LDDQVPVLDAVETDLPVRGHLGEAARRRLLGRYGADAPDLVAAAQDSELEAVPGTQTLWAELRWAARAEGVIHLDDLLLRRVRLGHVLPEGGKALLPRIRAICQPELGWDDAEWDAAESAYVALWHEAYGLPPRETIPDWRPMLAAARAQRAAALPVRRRTVLKRSGMAGLLLGLAVALGMVYWRWRRA
jgi:glycerol-3-phosphate dehydrogenase